MIPEGPFLHLPLASVRITVMGQISNFMHELKPALVMVVVQVLLAAGNVFYKLAETDGMSLKIIVAYRFGFATAFIVPLAVIFERNDRQKLTWMVLFQAFLSGLFGGSLSQNLFLKGLALTSATFTTAMCNLVPAITFILAISLGLEKLGLSSPAGQAKLLGTLIGIGGAMVLTFYKGMEIKFKSSTQTDHMPPRGSVTFLDANSAGYLLGALYTLGSCLCYGFWLIVQAKMMKRYPYPYSSTALMSAMATIQATVLALCEEEDWQQWKLGWDIRLLSLAYLGVAATGVTTILMSWCVRVRGPLFVSVFMPLSLVLVALASILLLDEKLHLGSIIGAVLIVCGLYGVLWGKVTEMKNTQLSPSTSSEDIQQSIKEPFMPLNKEQDLFP